MADIVKTVGDGHALPDYATLTLWNAAEGGNDPGVGFTSIAECSGFCGAGANINGAFVRGAIIRGDVTWDGTNGASLADTERLTISAGSGIDVTDLRIFTNNQFVSAMNYNADFIDMDRVIFDNTTAAVNALDINGNFPNGNIRNFVARGGADTIMAGYLQGTNLTNGLIYGATDKGVEGGGSTPLILTDVLVFNNGGEDVDSAGGFTLNNVATEDSTGTYTGYTSAELVDFAGGDLRTKSTSDLATLGSPFIGAFLESGGGSEVNVSDSLSDSVSSANNDSAVYVGGFSVFDLSNNSAGSVSQDAILFASTVNVSDSISGSLSNSADDSVYLVGELLVNDLIVDSSSSANQDNVTLAATISVNDSLINSISLAINDSIKLSGAFDVIEQLVNSSAIANSDLVAFSSTVSVSDQSSNSQSDSLNDEVSFVGVFSIDDQLTNSLSLANVETISFSGEIILTDGVVSSSSLSTSDFIQIGAFNFTVYKETNISSTFKSRNIDSASLSTNIDS